MRQKKVVLKKDEIHLTGILRRPDSEELGAVIILHPHPRYGGDSNNVVVLWLEALFVGLGLCTLRFDFRGTNQNPHGYSGVESAVEDAEIAIKEIGSSTGYEKVGIAGYSFGGSVALSLALETDPLFLITMSASKSLFETRENKEEPHQFSCPILMFHGTRDSVVPTDDMKSLAGKIRGTDVLTVRLEDEGHFYRRTLSTVKMRIESFMTGVFDEKSRDVTSSI